MIVLAVMLTCTAFAAGEAPIFESQLIFDPAVDGHGHVHASCVVECPNGDLRAVWYENGPEMPPPHFNDQKDKSDDVRLGGSRKPAGAENWDAPFVMFDTFGVSDNNPCMVVDRENRLWLIHATLLGVPVNSWGSALVQYHVSSEYAQPGPPRWERESILVVHQPGLEKNMFTPKGETGAGNGAKNPIERLAGRLKDPLKIRLGWMPRAHPIIRSDGTLLLPLANENYTLSAMALTNDGGATWTISDAVPGTGIIQPTVVEFPDGAMAAFFRNSHISHRILRSNSKDGGMTWSSLEKTDLPHPGSGIEAILLSNGHLLMIYNDKDFDPRDRLAVSISEDQGKTWKWTRHLENTPNGRFDYPSLVQGRDGSLHATYSLNTKTIKYAHFNEAWVQQGD